MASVQAHLLDLLVRATVKRRLRGVTDVATARRVLESGALPTLSGVTFEPASLGGVPGEWARAGAGAGRTLLYLHGGGYFACSPRTHRPLTAAYARRGFDVFVPDYRLAPEHPFPAALDDAKAVWRGLVEAGHAPASLAVSGDSAGGGLCLSLMLALRGEGAALPGAAALFSPWTDLAATGPSIATNAARDAMFWGDGLFASPAFYLGDTSPTDPLASPHYAELGGLPPMLVHVGEREMLRDDGVRLAEHASAAGVAVELQVWPVVPHVWQLAQFVPEARRSVDGAAAFIRKHATVVSSPPQH